MSLNQKWAEEKLKDLERERLLLISEADRLKTVVQEREGVIDGLTKGITRSEDERRRLSELMDTYAIRDAEWGSLQKECMTLREELGRVDREGRAAVRERDELIEGLRDQLARTASQEMKLRDYASKVDSLREAEGTCKELRARVKALEEALH